MYTYMCMYIVYCCVKHVETRIAQYPYAVQLAPDWKMKLSCGCSLSGDNLTS